MKKFILLGTVCMACVFVSGCAGKVTQVRLKDKSGAAKEMTFPKGTLFGGMSKDQAAAIAQISADSHNLAMEQMQELNATVGNTDRTVSKIDGATRMMDGQLRKIDETGRKIEASTSKIETTTQKLEGDVKKVQEVTQKIEGTTQKIDGNTLKILDTGEKNYDATKLVIQALEKLSKKQGTGEVTIFFPVGSSDIPKGSLEYQRLVNFADFLSKESHGRKIIFVSVGSASAFGPKQINEDLAKRRAESPLKVLEQYLVNIPHEFFKVYGTGDEYSPKDVAMDVHQRYQHSRVIAVYESSQIPETPGEVKKEIKLSQK